MYWVLLTWATVHVRSASNSQDKTFLLSSGASIKEGVLCQVMRREKGKYRCLAVEETHSYLSWNRRDNGEVVSGQAFKLQKNEEQQKIGQGKQEREFARLWKVEDRQ